MWNCRPARGPVASQDQGISLHYGRGLPRRTDMEQTLTACSGGGLGVHDAHGLGRKTCEGCAEIDMRSTRRAEARRGAGGGRRTRGRCGFRARTQHCRRLGMILASSGPTGDPLGGLSGRLGGLLGRLEAIWGRLAPRSLQERCGKPTCETYASPQS